MMKKIKFLLLTFLLAGSVIFPQNRFSLDIGYGNYLSNSENSLRIMGDEKYRSYIFYGFSFQKEDLYGLNLMLEYSYNNIKKDDIIKFYQTGEASPEIIGSFNGDMTLICHNIDLSYIKNIGKNFSLGAGPSFVITNRIFEIDRKLTIDTRQVSLYDKLASSGLGLSGFLMFSLPLTEDQKLFLNSKLKLRYTHSVWFDKGIRNLDDYNQDFLTAQISAGIGYSF
ncbi:MAG: hypothetical protein ACM34K_19570 [Bacillota bacterium]